MLVLMKLIKLRRKDTFTNPKSLYTYFSLMVDLYDAKKKPASGFI